MGGKRYSGNEVSTGDQSGADDGASRAAGSDRCDAVNGFKKLALMLLVFATVWCFRGCVINRVIVDGDSMNPSFSDGDVLWARAFNIDELSRYQVVVADIDGKLVIKRVIGLPGEALQIIEGFVYVNGVKLDDECGGQTTLYGCAEQEIILGEDEYFLMGDNRNNSRDSREWGAVDILNIEGVVVFRFFPFWKVGAVG